MAKRGTLDHEKTMDLADRLGIMEPFALGVLEAFWQWTAQYHPDGDVSGVRPSLMARAIRYTGDADVLWGAFIACELIDVGGDRQLVHDWSDHADEIVHTVLARKCLRFADGRIPNSGRLNQHERERFQEWVKDQPGFSQPDRDIQTQVSQKSAKSQPKVSRDSAQSPKPIPKPIPIPEPIPEPKEKPSCAEASSAPPLGTLPCLGGKSWPFTQADVSAWAEAYPAIDVLTELRKDREWLKANPRNMKTLGGMRKHVNSWLARAQNEARGDPKPASRSMQQPGYNPDSPEGRVFTRDDIERLREKRTRGEPMSPLLSGLVDRYDREMQTAQLSGVM